MEPSDHEVLAAAVGGEREAFAVLYRRRRPDVYRFALHMTGSPHAADDIVQEVFMAVIRDGRRYVPGRATVLAWLLGIARNHVRRRGAERATETLSEETHGYALVTGAAQVDSIGRAQQLARLRRAVVALPRVYREAVVLCDLQELSYVDAAAALDCAVGTIRSRLHRGRALLAATLRRERPRVGGRAPKWVL